jgi:hypothetical protein
MTETTADPAKKLLREAEAYVLKTLGALVLLGALRGSGSSEGHRPIEYARLRARMEMKNEEFGELINGLSMHGLINRRLRPRIWSARSFRQYLSITNFGARTHSVGIDVRTTES